jgi:hypothetical protein
MQYEFPPQPLLPSSEGMERVMSSMLDEVKVKAGKMAVKASISDQEFAMLKRLSAGYKILERKLRQRRLKVL